MRVKFTLFLIGSGIRSLIELILDLSRGQDRHKSDTPSNTALGNNDKDLRGGQRIRDEEGTPPLGGHGWRDDRTSINQPV